MQSGQHKALPALSNNQAVSHLLTGTGITRQVLTEMFHTEDTYLEVCFAAVESLKLQYDTPFKLTPPLTRGLSDPGQVHRMGVLDQSNPEWSAFNSTFNTQIIPKESVPASIVGAWPICNLACGFPEELLVP